MIRLLKKEILAELNKDIDLYATSFLHLSDLSSTSKNKLNEVNVCAVGHLLRTLKNPKDIQNLFELCQDIHLPRYEVAFLDFKNHEFFKGLPKTYSPEYRPKLISLMLSNNYHLSLLSSEFEHLMDDFEFKEKAPKEVLEALKLFIISTLPEILKEV